jgi:hypothetical protein
LDADTPKKALDDLILMFQKHDRKESKTYNQTRITYTLDTTKSFVIHDDVPLDIMEKFFDKVIKGMKDAYKIKDNDKLSFFLQDKEHLSTAINLSFNNADSITGKTISDKVAKLLNSNQTIAINNFDFGFVHIVNPDGGRHLQVLSKGDYGLKKGYVIITNKDESCFVRAL